MRLSTFILVLFISFMVAEPAIASIVDQFDTCIEDCSEDDCECTCNPFASCESCAGFYISQEMEVESLAIQHFIDFNSPIDAIGTQESTDIFRPPISIS